MQFNRESKVLKCATVVSSWCVLIRNAKYDCCQYIIAKMSNFIYNNSSFFIFVPKIKDINLKLKQILLTLRGEFYYKWYEGYKIWVNSYYKLWQEFHKARISNCPRSYKKKYIKKSINKK